MEEMQQLLGQKALPSAPQNLDQPSPVGLPGPIGEAILSQDPSVMKTSKEEAAAMVRYGPTVAATLATGGLSLMPSVLLNAGIIGASEFTARQIERGINSPEGQNLMEDLKAGSNLALVDAGISMASMGSLKLLGMGARKFATSRLGKEILDARKLFKTKIEEKAFEKVGKELPLEDPFDLTFAELSREDGGLVAALDDFASSGTGSGVMKKYRKNRLAYYYQVIDDYYSDLLDKRDKHGIAAFVKQALGDIRNPGDLVQPVTAYKKHLYNQFDQEMVRNHSSATIDLSHIRKYLKTKKIMDIYSLHKRGLKTDAIAKRLGTLGTFTSTSEVNNGYLYVIGGGRGAQNEYNSPCPLDIQIGKFMVH